MLLHTRKLLILCFIFLITLTLSGCSSALSGKYEDTITGISFTFSGNEVTIYIPSIGGLPASQTTTAYQISGNSISFKNNSSMAVLSLMGGGNGSWSFQQNGDTIYVGPYEMVKSGSMVKWIIALAALLIVGLIIKSRSGAAHKMLK